MSKINVKISLVAPVYNEASNIKLFINRAVKVLERFAKYELIFCIDPSTDNTFELIQSFAKDNKNIKGLLMTRKFGQAPATFAGIRHATGDYVSVIDADLQDPPELVLDLYKKLIESNSEIALAQRRSRQGETLIKKLITFYGYKIINNISDSQIPVNTGDFRLMSKKVVNELVKFNEPHCFLRGLVSIIGFKTCFVQYDRDPRFADKGKYNRYLGSLEIGFNGIFGFSSKPLRLMFLFGFAIILLSFILIIWYLIQKFYNPNITPGLSTTVILISFFSGLNIFSIGLIGEYVARIYDQVKGRPIYIIDKKINLK